jgi:hypothetical protein
MTGQELVWFPTGADQELFKYALAHIASERGLAGFMVSDALLTQAATIVTSDGLI